MSGISSFHAIFIKNRDTYSTKLKRFLPETPPSDPNKLLETIFIEFSLQFISFICRSLQSETSINFSNFDRQDFVKIKIFDSYDVTLM